MRLTRRRDVVPRAGKAPLFTLIEAVPAATEIAATTRESPLVIREATGQRSVEAAAMRSAFGMPNAATPKGASERN